MRRRGHVPGRVAFGRTAAAISTVLVALLGCAGTPEQAADDAPTLDVRFDPVEVWAEVRDTQAARLEGLASFTSAGTTTIRFSDGDDGADVRTEQVELRVWRIAPDRAAVRLSKVGASFLLAGWNGDRWWVLDESRDETVLRVRRVDAARPERGAEGLLAPPVLLSMIGLLPWPVDPPPGLAPIRLDDDGKVAGVRFELSQIAWPTLGGPDLSLPGRLEVEIERFQDGPARLRMLDAAGEVMLESTLTRSESVETRGRPPGSWPTLPHRMRVFRANGDEISVALDAPLAGGEISERLFDLDAILRRHPEAILDGLGAGGAIEPDGDAE